MFEEITPLCLPSASQDTLRNVGQLASFSEEEAWVAFRRGGMLFLRQVVATHLVQVDHLSMEDAAYRVGLPLERLHQFFQVNTLSPTDDD